MWRKISRVYEGTSAISVKKILSVAILRCHLSSVQKRYQMGETMKTEIVTEKRWMFYGGAIMAADYTVQVGEKGQWVTVTYARLIDVEPDEVEAEVVSISNAGHRAVYGLPSSWLGKTVVVRLK